jgi:hypothetical protein
MSSTSQLMDGFGHFGMTSDQAQEICEQMLSVGQEFASAYIDAYQKTAAGIAELQDRVEKGGWPTTSADGPLRSVSAIADAPEPVREARTNALEVGETLQNMTRKVLLAYLNATELAALAVADCQEELAAASGMELFKTVGGARVGLGREMTKAYVAAARGIVG